MNDITLKPSGKRLISFTGELLGEGSTWRAEGSSRWTDVEIYRTAKGHYVASVEHRTQWADEKDHCDVFHADDAEGIIRHLCTEDGGNAAGPASEKAILEAADADDGIKAAWTEKIE